MRKTAALLLLLGSAFAAPPKAPHCVASRKLALEMARTRGKLILLTVIVDHDGENRAVVEHVFRDAAFLKISHGKVAVKTKSGKRVPRCADCPSIECENHMQLAQHWARGFYEGAAKTPVHFIISADEDVVELIYNGDFKTGMNHVSPKVLVAELKKVLKKHGRGLSEKQFKEMTSDLAEARAARARKNTPLELKRLLSVAALPQQKIEGVVTAKQRLIEIDKLAAREMKKVEALLGNKEWESGLDGIEAVIREFPGTPTAIMAAARRSEVLRSPAVKRLLKAAGLYQRGMKYKEIKKLELARKKFEQLVRRYADTRYGELAQKELDAMGDSG